MYGQTHGLTGGSTRNGGLTWRPSGRGGAGAVTRASWMRRSWSHREGARSRRPAGIGDLRGRCFRGSIARGESRVVNGVGERGGNERPNQILVSLTLD